MLVASIKVINKVQKIKEKVLSHNFKLQRIDTNKALDIYVAESGILDFIVELERDIIDTITIMKQEL
jgi:hypothetical protein